jgi:hypothetical protein
VSCPRDSLTKAFDGSENLVSGLDPDERLRVSIPMVDVIADGALEFQGAAMNAAPQLPVRKLGEEARST